MAVTRQAAGDAAEAAIVIMSMNMNKPSGRKRRRGEEHHDDR
ncbi:hypothetical protein KNP414_05978 [Paenibacillus mucilaginosus KNP414]|uniref:Uncharacterized protein n=1 Tax=Paenibacillus mucilaginosus (strain KNP414) TaxID=1036673 RepID=F8FCA1_PAEMK|nr:hypothetical protein KNP414_05978 [Paenibacillus mucilaginosus KNP414]